MMVRSRGVVALVIVALTRNSPVMIVGERLAPESVNMALYGGLAALALVLATLGIMR